VKNLILLAAAFAASGLVACGRTEAPAVADSAKLMLVRPAAVTLRRGGTATADIRITRRDVPGRVSVCFTNLPHGVAVVDEGSVIVGDQCSYTLRATETAELVEDFAADVTASAGPANVSVSDAIRICVRPKD